MTLKCVLVLVVAVLGAVAGENCIQDQARLPYAPDSGCVELVFSYKQKGPVISCPMQKASTINITFLECPPPELAESAFINFTSLVRADMVYITDKCSKTSNSNMVYFPVLQNTLFLNVMSFSVSDIVFPALQSANKIRLIGNFTGVYLPALISSLTVDIYHRNSLRTVFLPLGGSNDLAAELYLKTQGLTTIDPTNFFIFAPFAQSVQTWYSTGNLVSCALSTTPDTSTELFKLSEVFCYVAKKTSFYESAVNLLSAAFSTFANSDMPLAMKFLNSFSNWMGLLFAYCKPAALQKDDDKYRKHR